MKKFLYKILLFSIPGIIWIIPPIVILMFSGENYAPIDNLISGKSKYLIGYAYNEENYKYLKWKEATSKKKVDILALGSSRILQFRESMFDSSFYNAGYTISNIPDFIPFLKSMPENKYPEVLLINLDQWLFNKNTVPSKGNTSFSASDVSFNHMASFQTFKNVWADIFKGKYSYTGLLNKYNNTTIKKVGLNATLNDKGFRNDGSMYYGNQISKLINKDSTVDDYNFKDTYARIHKGIRGFEYGNQINEAAIQELTKFLRFCSYHNIYVIAILPPFADRVNEYFETNGHHTYIRKIYPEVSPVFKKFGFELWDMSHLSTYNSGDHETIDGFHGGEVAYLKMLCYLLEHQSILNKYTSTDKLKQNLQTKINDYLVYDY